MYMRIPTFFQIGTRLGFGFVLVLAFATLISAVAIWELHSLAQTSREVMQEPMTKERLIGEWNRVISVAVIRTSAIAKSSDPSLVPFFAANASETTKTASELQKTIEPLLSSDEEKVIFSGITQTRKTYLLARDQVARLKTEGKSEQANEVLEKEYVPVAANYMKLVSQLLQVQRKAIDQKATDITAIQRSSRAYLLILTVVVIGLGSISAWLLTKGITGPLTNAVAILERAAHGDLATDISIDGKDETSQLLLTLKDMQTSLGSVVTRVRQGAQSVATASAEIARGNLDLSARTEQQASALQETAAAMDELSTTVKQNADSAAKANELAQSASSVAIQSGAVVAQVVDTMRGISDSSRKISDIISVIDGIAFQTNILALNAAVEAARAGEQGRGFAVVASEVRALAARSADAAKEIKTLINTSVEQVEQGTALVDQAGVTMTEVVNAIKRVTDLVGEISAASNEQSADVAQVGQAVARMDQSTQQNAALVEEMAAAASSLKSQADELVGTVAVFKLEGDDEDRGVVGPAMATSRQVRELGYKDASDRRLAAPTWIEAATSDGNIHLDNAIEAHAQWRIKLRAATVRGEWLDSDTIAQDNCCPLGHWMAGEGNSMFAGKLSFVSLISAHRKFHREAGKVAQVINQGDLDTAAHMLDSGTSFSLVSNELTRLIVQLKSELNQAA